MKSLKCLLAGTVVVLSLTACQSIAQSSYTPYTLTTLAGSAGFGSADGTGNTARFNLPLGVAVDGAGIVYVADWGNDTIRKMTPGGVVTTVAGLVGSIGSADGTGVDARFSHPIGMAVDGAGSVYVADSWNNTIRKVTPAGVVTTLAGLAGSIGSADGLGSVARFYYPYGLTADSVGNIYVADTDNDTIRKVTSAGVVTTLAGLAGHSGGRDGIGNDARFNQPQGVAFDGAGNVYVADTGSGTIRKVTPGGVVTTVATGFENPSGVAVDSMGNVYVANYGDNTIQKVTPVGVVATLAGLSSSFNGSADGTGSDARFWRPFGVTVDTAGDLYVSDTLNNTIRKVTSAGVVTTPAGLAIVSYGSSDGIGSDARFGYPYGVAVDGAGNVYVGDEGNHTIRKMTPAGEVTTLAGLAGAFGGSSDGTNSAARFDYPRGVAADGAGNVYVADSRNYTIRKITPAGVVTTLAGLADGPGSVDGTGTAAQFYSPSSVAVDSSGIVYVADTYNHTIRKVTPSGVVTTLAGVAGNVGSADGTGNAQFNQPYGVAVDSSGIVYVADTYNHTIRRVAPSGTVTTLAGLASNPGSADGTGTAARFNQPYGVAVDRADNVYVADWGNATIRKVTPTGVVTTLAGVPGYDGSADGTGNAVRFGTQNGGLSSIAVDNTGNVYVADSANNTIRKGYPALMILNAGFSNGGQFGFTLTGPSGRSVVVDVSANLLNWLPVWTNTFAGDLHFSGSASGTLSSNRFYRAHLP